MDRDDWIAIGLLGLIVGIPVVVTGIINILQGTMVGLTLSLSGWAAVVTFLWLIAVFLIDTKIFKEQVDAIICLILLISGDIISIVIFGVFF